MPAVPQGGHGGGSWAVHGFPKEVAALVAALLDVYQFSFNGMSSMPEVLQ